MDQSGDIAIGYSTSSSTIHPAVRYTGRVPSDTAGTLESEASIMEGTGSQTNGLHRWGDYSSLRIDPSDDCTFWYINEYLVSDGAFNWSTRVGSFKFTSCGQALASTATTLGSSPNPSTYGVSVTFTATVSSGTGTPTGSVTFKDGATTLGTSPLNGGQATLSTSSLAGGAHSITASFSGDSSHASSTSTSLMQTVNQAGTTTTLSSGANPSTWGQNVTFTATVSPSSATGTVQFTIDGSTGSPVPVSGGKASVSTSTLSVGPHSLTAAYSGDANYGASTSSILNQTVNKAGTTTTLTSSPNPSNTGQTVTFTATVSPSIATGSVTFKDGATTLGTVSLSSGKATLATATLAAGLHQVTANYGGDGNYNGSASGILNQQVNSAAADFSISVSPPSQTVTQGGSTTYTVTIAPANGFTGTVKLSVSGLPSRASGSFNPSSVGGGSGNSTLTISTNRKTPTRTYTFTVSGTSGTLQHTMPVTLIVN
jgi:hypothetical protein